MLFSDSECMLLFTTAPPPMQARTTTEGIWNCFNEIIEKCGASVVGETGNTDVEQYLREPHSLSQGKLFPLLERK